MIWLTWPMLKRIAPARNQYAKVYDINNIRQATGTWFINKKPHNDLQYLGILKPYFSFWLNL
ncbi:hypothetical protein EV13_2463 [Prochlorococcus sp. MIT 0702]|nr:hypothetical protein EV13_2463 [Prochlorococcus sp. MIT 0702]KGG31252.1 hypothetical protein EV14_2624 [Prochlorococcus sp. MIT 0703]